MRQEGEMTATVTYPVNVPPLGVRAWALICDLAWGAGAETLLHRLPSAPWGAFFARCFWLIRCLGTVGSGRFRNDSIWKLGQHAPTWSLESGSG